VISAVYYSRCLQRAALRSLLLLRAGKQADRRASTRAAISYKLDEMGGKKKKKKGEKNARN